MEVNHLKKFVSITGVVQEWNLQGAIVQQLDQSNLTWENRSGLE